MKVDSAGIFAHGKESRGDRLDIAMGSLRQVLAVEMLEYEDKNCLTGDNKTRSQSKQVELLHAMEIIAENMNKLDERKVGVACAPTKVKTDWLTTLEMMQVLMSNTTIIAEADDGERVEWTDIGITFKPVEGCPLQCPTMGSKFLKDRHWKIMPKGVER